MAKVDSIHFNHISRYLTPLGALVLTAALLQAAPARDQQSFATPQDAIQATDYAAATSNMSKFEILSQTGIAALAQANSIQREVTKLLQ